MKKEDFFERVDGLSLVEENIRNIVSLEMVEARKLSVIYRKTLDDLRAELALGKHEAGSFSQARLKLLIKKLDLTLDLIKKRMSGEVLTASKIMAKQSYKDLFEEMNTLEKAFQGINTPIPWEAQKYSLDGKNYLVNKFQASINSYSEKIRNDIMSSLTQSLAMRHSYEQAKNRLKTSLRDISLQDWQIARIARTELHNIYNSSKINSMVDIKKKFAPDLMKTVVVPMDARTAEDSKYLASLNQVRPVGEPFVYKWGKSERRFYAPPDRPNDRSILIPVRNGWLKT